MHSTDFFNKLINECKHIPESKLDKIISYYNNEIFIGRCNGKTEDEILLNFGDLDKIIYEINNNTDEFIKNTFDLSSSKKIVTNRFKENKKSYYNNIEENNKNSSNYINYMLKILIAILTITIIIPLTTTIIGFILGLLGVFIATCAFALYILFNVKNLNSVPRIPVFLVNFPQVPLILFCLSAICISTCLIICIFYLLKHIILYFVKVYKSDRKNKGGDIIEK